LHILCATILGAATCTGTSSGSERFLLSHVDSTMGFGDKQNYYYGLMLLGRVTNRTVVLPPFQIEYLK